MTDVMARPLARFEGAELGRRTVSAAVVVAIAGVALWQGSWLLAALVAFATAMIAWEWAGICGCVSQPLKILLAVAAAAVCLVAAGWGSLPGWILLGVATATAAAAAAVLREPAAPLALVGLPYAGGAGIVLLWLRLAPEAGFATVVWLVCIVAASDVGAYLVGRSVGGPKLAPRVSPRKTWSGLLGGMAFGAAASVMAAVFFEAAVGPWTLAFGAGYAVLSQVGDLTESGLKRRFSVKDSGGLIPGHGGVFDRLDGYPLVIFATACLTIGAGETPLLW